MGRINETFTLTDNFSASFHTFIQLGEQAVQSAASLDKNLTRAMGKSAGATIGAIRSLGDSVRETNQLLEQVIEDQKRHTSEIERTDKSANKLLSTFKQIAAATGAITLTKSFLELSDAQAQTNARISMMNDGLQTTEELQRMIYQSAQRARADYDLTADSITKMALNSGQAFQSNQELIAFMEAVNKQFAIGGAGAAQMNAAMVQLTQAMGAGALRGEELNSILDAAPGIARNIEKYMGWASGSIKQYAEQGLVSAEVVKNAMLSSSEEINQQFQEMPMTLSQAFTMVRNEIQNSLQDSASQWSDFLNSADGQRILNGMISLFSLLAEVGLDALSAVGQGALLAVDNLDVILSVLGAIGLAYALLHAQAIATAAASAGGAIATAAAWAAANWPILLLVAVLAGAMIAAQQFGIGMQEVGAAVGAVFGFIYAIGYNCFALLWNVIASFAEFFANVWKDPLGATVKLFTNVFDAILGMVESVASAIDALLGSDLSGAVSGFRGKLSGWVDENFGESAVQIKRMANLDVGTTAAQFSQYGSHLGAKLDNMSLNLGDIAGSMSGFDASSLPKAGAGGGAGNVGKVGSVGNVKNIEGDVKLSDEDLKLYQDLAERRYMNRIELKTLAPNISVSIPERAAGNLSGQDVADKLKVLLIEQMGAHSTVSHE